MQEKDPEIKEPKKNKFFSWFMNGAEEEKEQTFSDKIVGAMLGFCLIFCFAVYVDFKNPGFFQYGLEIITQFSRNVLSEDTKTSSKEDELIKKEYYKNLEEWSGYSVDVGATRTKTKSGDLCLWDDETPIYCITKKALAEVRRQSNVKDIFNPETLKAYKFYQKYGLDRKDVEDGNFQPITIERSKR